ncbi:two-component system sensor histidine kinase SenX3 [Actinocorallia herbida]|uniref:Sensor-like histidine kinase SenX3 n=1 Tax=Actinocorallia herbida TaxID=58109 RepID=A0A3N1D9N8_9ACTN|nr:ATP-binding protein [Actinocorallia herbida]ROO90245.1 two-component system sensor histidine kinase SenX3 [Actinocorallia herbida]
MNVELAVGLAGFVGLTGGLVTGLAIRWTELAQGRAQPPQPPVVALPPGVSSVLNVLPSSAVVLDTDDKVLRASSAARAFGMVSGDRLMVDEILALARRVRRDGEIREAEVQVGVADSRWFAVRVAPLGSGGLVLVLAEDLTEMRRVESIRRDFSANVSHELKTPVGALLLLAETVQDAAEDQVAVRRFAGRMQLEAARLSSLVQDLITLSYVQGEEPLAQEEPVAVADLVADAVDRATLTAQAREIHLGVAVTPDLYVRGDEELLVMALKNLVDNAIAYSPERTKVAISTRVVDDEERPYAEISVTDQGIGIPEPELERIFERFYRVDPARSRQTGGTGLGLAIVKHVATKHGGEVIVWSKEGSGSTFTLRLPLREHPRSLDQSVREDNP